MVESQMTNGARYVLRSEFGIVAKIETALDTSMIKLAMKAELFDLKAEELVRVLDHRVGEYARKLAAERS